MTNAKAPVAKYKRINTAVAHRLMAVLALLVLVSATMANAQNASSPTATPSPTPTATASPTPTPTQTAVDKNQSERSDQLTGGRVEVAEFAPDQPDIRLTLNIPSFRLTLWQNGREVKSYYIGVGMKAHPLYIGDREARAIIWNPDWIPPSSDWVLEMASVSPGEVIKASDPRNPLGKLKIPLGGSYLIHQAAKMSDVGNLVSHGCVRMPLADLYDLADRIIAARSLAISPKRIAAAKRSTRTLVVRLGDPLPVDINYDTLVVEEGVLHIYPDVYGRGDQPPRATARRAAVVEYRHVEFERRGDQEDTAQGVTTYAIRRREEQHRARPRAGGRTPASADPEKTEGSRH